MPLVAPVMMTTLFWNVVFMMIAMIDLMIESSTVRCS